MIADHLLRKNLIELKAAVKSLPRGTCRPTLDIAIRETEEYLAEFDNPVPVPLPPKKTEAQLHTERMVRLRERIARNRRLSAAKKRDYEERLANGADW